MKRLIISLSFFLLIASAQTGARYLVITHDGFYDAATQLAEWKNHKGMRSKVVKLSETGSSAYDIRNYILNAYNTWDIQPEYLLLVGAGNYIPFPTVSGTSSDNYYTDLEGDIYNDILSGRLTVHTADEARTVVNKILTYERNPFIGDSLWFKKSCLMVRRDYDQDDSIYWSDLHYAAGLMVNNGFVEIDSLCDSYGNNWQDILNAVNEGRAFVQYRGSAINNWWSPFNINPEITENGAMLPIVMSITCSCMGTGSTPATAERWLLTGTPTLLRGGSGYFATTTVIGGGAHLRSAVSKGFFRTIFSDGEETFGMACEGGRKNVYQMYPGSGLHEYLGFTTLGDPEMHIWTDTPCSLTVNHPTHITYGYAQVPVNVTGAVHGLPISQALVCLCSDQDTSLYALDTTDVLGNALINVAPQVIDDTVYITVTGKNLKPYESSMIVMHIASYVLYLDSWINDSSGGNYDGEINPAEDIIMPLRVVNLGESTAVDVTGKLRTSSSYITITDSIKTFGDIPSRDTTSTGSDGYEFTVAYDTPDQRIIDFELICNDINDSTWISTFHKTVHAPAFDFESYAVYGGNGNSTIEPAETVDLVITLKNQGSAPADSIISIVFSSAPEITILDTSGFISHIGPDSTGNNQLDPFVVCVDESTAVGTVISCTLATFSNYCQDTFAFDLLVSQKNYFVWDPDPIPSSGQKIDSILKVLNYEGDYGVTMPSYLNLYQVLFVCLGVYSNRYLISQVSPEAIMITDYLNTGGRVYLEGSSAWFVDPMYFGAHDFGSLFGINGTDWSLADMGPLEGQNNTFTNSMYFNYTGENWYMDHLMPSGGFIIFRDQDDAYNCAIANDASIYRTVGTSFELGSLEDNDPPSTRAILLDSIMHFFGTVPGIEEIRTIPALPSILFDIRPNPFTDITSVYLAIEKNQYDGNENIITDKLRVFDISGRLVKNIALPTIYESSSSNNKILLITQWDGTDQCGKKLAAGVYFIHFTHGRSTITKKLVLVD